MTATKSPFTTLLAGVNRHRGVLGSMIVSEDDGLVVDSHLQIGVDGHAVGALAASLYRKARLSAAAAGLGDTRFLQLEAERGRLCVVGRAGVVLVAVAEPRANVGLIRAHMLDAAGGLG